MPDKMIRNAGLGDDGTAKAMRTDNFGRLKVGIEGNTIQEVLLAEEITVGANERVLVGGTNIGQFDLSDTEHISVGVFVDSTHEYDVEVNRRNSHNRAFDIVPTPIKTGTSHNTITSLIPVVSIKGSVHLVNRSNEPKKYTVYLYKHLKFPKVVV